jgi:hypothetical protein
MDWTVLAREILFDKIQRGPKKMGEEKRQEKTTPMNFKRETLGSVYGH